MTGQDRPGGAILAGPAVPGVAGPGCWAVLPQVLPQCLDYFLIPSPLVEDPVQGLAEALSMSLSQALPLGLSSVLS